MAGNVQYCSSEVCTRRAISSNLHLTTKLFVFVVYEDIDETVSGGKGDEGPYAYAAEDMMWKAIGLSMFNNDQQACTYNSGVRSQNPPATNLPLL